MIYLLLGFYILIALLILKEWIIFLDTDKEMSSQMRLFSQIVLIFAIILWPFVVPFAYLELLKFHQKHRQIIITLISSPQKNGFKASSIHKRLYDKVALSQVEYPLIQDTSME